jgi:hypothetical protein
MTTWLIAAGSKAFRRSGRVTERLAKEQPAQGARLGADTQIEMGLAFDPAAFGKGKGGGERRGFKRDHRRVGALGGFGDLGLQRGQISGLDRALRGVDGTGGQGDTERG